ncbi:MAG: flagellar hook-basal body complex protein [Oscillospiraceae bacterium]|nr:flagellar hook-basal body complex protein [Oscillospiraceae bacterium]
MIRSLFSGVTGLKTHNQRMDVIGNNIANVNTTAFKGSTVTFKDVYYQTRQRASGGDYTQGGVNPMQTGLGVQLGTVSKVMSQSGITFSDSVFDLALEGAGFFQVMDQMGNIFYTRLGRFSLDDMGNLTDPNGNIVLGVSGDPTNIPASSQRIAINIPDIPDQAAYNVSAYKGHEITISAGGFGPGGNIALTIVQSDSPFATMTGQTLNVYMDLSKDYEADAVRRLAGPDVPVVPATVPPTFVLARPTVLPVTVPATTPIPGVHTLNAAQAALISQMSGNPAAAGDAVTAAHAALFSQAVVQEVSQMFTDDMTEAIRLGGIPLDDALNPLMGGGLDVTFGTVPEVTAPQQAENFIRMPEMTQAALESSLGGVPVAGTPLNTLQINAINSYRAQTGGTALTAAEITNAAATAAATLTEFNTIVAAGMLENQLHFIVDKPGAFGNAYRIDLKTSTTAGFAYPTAQWKGNVLELTLPADVAVSIADIQNVIDNAALGREDFEITVTGRTPTTPGGTDYTPVAFINTLGLAGKDGARVSPAGGTNSFFEEAFKNLGTVRLLDGYFAGPQSADTAEIFIDRDGIIYGYHPFHKELILGRIDIVDFVNPSGLNQIGTSYFTVTQASGNPQVRIPRDESDTQIISGALEMSNVDLSQEFSDMIITQRGFQANSRIITVSDSMLEELINLKR